MTALRFTTTNNNAAVEDNDAYNDSNKDDNNDDVELRVQKQWLELQRLLYCMEKGGSSVVHHNEHHHDHHHHTYHWREILFRAEHCHTLWQSLLQMDAQAQRLAQRVDQACRKAHEQVDQLRHHQQQEQQQPDQDQPVEETIDVIDRIFGGHNQPKQQDDDMDANDKDNCNQPDADMDDDDDPYDGLLDEEGEDDDKQYQSDQGGQEETHYNIQDFQKQQREQMEEAIALMAAQMKEATRGIQSQLQQQTAKTLTELETVAEQNVHDVAAVAQNVQQHNQRQQRRNWGTWTLLFTVVGIFVLCLMTIFTIPKRPNTCLVFCQQDSSLIGLWVVQPVNVFVVQPLKWLWQQYLDGELEQDLSNDHENHEWNYLYDEDEMQRREKEKLDQLLQSLKSDSQKPKLDLPNPKVKTVDWREAMEDEVFEGWESAMDETNNVDPTTTDDVASSMQQEESWDNDDENDDDDEDEDEDEDDGEEDDDQEANDHDYSNEVEADTHEAAEEEEEEEGEQDMMQDDSSETQQEDAGTHHDSHDETANLVGIESLEDPLDNNAVPDSNVVDGHETLAVEQQNPMENDTEPRSEMEGPNEEQPSLQETQPLDGEQIDEATGNINPDVVDGTASDTMDTDPLANQESEPNVVHSSSDSTTDSMPSRDPEDPNSGGGTTVTQEILPNGELGTNPPKVPDTVQDVNMAALLASLNQAAQQTQTIQEDLVASEAMVNNNKKLPPLGSLEDVPPGTAKPREGEARTRISPRDLRHAADIGDVQRLEECLSLQPDFVDRPDKNQWTALHLAARRGHTEAIRLLYDHGASLSVENKQGNTPLQEAIMHLGKDHVAVKLLRQLQGKDESSHLQQESPHDKLEAKRNAIRMALETTTIENDQDLNSYVKQGRDQLEHLKPKTSTKTIALEQEDDYANDLEGYRQQGRKRFEATL